jgi:hypothetical protein
MPRSHISAALLVLALATPVLAQEDTAAEPAAEGTEEEAPLVLVDMQVTIMNQSGQMLMRFEAVPDLGEETEADEAVADGEAPPAEPAIEAAPVDPRAAAGGELLRGGVVSNGNYGILTVPGGATVCTFTLISTLADGKTVEAKTDICANPIYTLLPSG